MRRAVQACLPALCFLLKDMNMKQFLSLALLAVGMLFAACTGCKSDKPQGPQPTEFEQSMTKKDTADVQKTIGQFFGFLKNKKYYDAAQMLYSRPMGEGSEVQLLSNKEMDDYVSFWKNFDFDSYSIDYVKFFSAENNEVACSVVLMKGQNGAPDAKTQMFFTPVYRDGTWHLILTDSRHGESTVTQEGETDAKELYERRDSLKKLYRKSDAAKENKK